MKRLALVATMLLSIATNLFAQSSDLQPLAVIKLNKTETITLKQLKSRVETYQKQTNAANFTVAQKKEILSAMIDEKLITQAAQKAGLSLTDTQVNQYFLQNLSQQVGRQVTEAEFAEIVKANTKLSLDDFMKQQVGMNVADYKAYLKNQLIAQQYVMSQPSVQEQVKSAAATDTEIRNFYEVNKSSFVQNDMLKLFLVVVPKYDNAENAGATANKMLNDFKDKKLTFDSIKANSDGKTYQGGDLLIQKSAQHAQQLGISIAELNELFDKKIGYISNLTETANDFQFYSIRQKYDMKILSISDVVQPETTITVYDYIRQNLTNNKQQQALLKAINELTKSFDTPENVDRKKTGDALDKILNW